VGGLGADGRRRRSEERAGRWRRGVCGYRCKGRVVAEIATERREWSMWSGACKTGQQRRQQQQQQRGRGQRRRVQVWAGGVFNNEQGRAAVLSDARHGGGQRVQKKGCGSGLDRDRNMSGSISIRGWPGVGRPTSRHGFQLRDRGQDGSRAGGSSCGEGREGSWA
jgi:hypothetical protein